MGATCEHRRLRRAGEATNGPCHCENFDDTFYRQIERDLAVWRKTGVGGQVETRMDQRLWPESIKRAKMQIDGNRLYLVNHPSGGRARKHGRMRCALEVILDALRHCTLPSVSFWLNVADWPLVPKKASEGPIPVLSLAKSDDYADILFPSPFLAFCAMGFEEVDMVDAGLTAFFNDYLPEESQRVWPTLYGPRMARVPLHEHARYKYLMHVDGTTYSSRIGKLLLLDSVVLKQESPFYEFYYPPMAPYVHYIPVHRTLEDLQDVYVWLSKHEADVLRVRNEAVRFADKYLTRKAARCYVVRLLHEYASLLTHPSSRDGPNRVDRLEYRGTPEEQKALFETSMWSA
ncbi:unnamed protein product [Vitrella brassicaformis CCMP3155]|uniref:Rhodanese domain-containing protein n=1 Tax=Vitrella brassicaformis (strain CCMP3155) TaxID=1169540 RepID=A0A0G4FX02_VITBC|nr:unnamed protein product [Vitrella brassicaformis CCMP3155]|eukprot:CEM19684.1 unnamed protein product [Vitrella brassicaformis CCMP3155]